MDRILEFTNNHPLLVAGTHGRSAYALDIAPLRELLAEDLAGAELHLFDLAAALLPVSAAATEESTPPDIATTACSPIPLPRASPNTGRRRGRPGLPRAGAPPLPGDGLGRPGRAGRPGSGRRPLSPDSRIHLA